MASRPTILTTLNVTSRSTLVRVLSALVLAVCVLTIGAPSVHAHGVLIDSLPLEGAGLDSSPTAIVLTFSEEPEPSLGTITVTDSSGQEVPVGEVTALSSSPLSVVAQMPPLEPGVYTVAWRVVSRVDGHATAGAFAFGVGMTPDQAQIEAAAESGSSRPTALELGARWLLLGGLVVVLGTVLGAALDFAGPRLGWPVFLPGMSVALVGLAGLALTQRASARVPFGDFLQTYPGRAVVWRLVFLVATALSAVVARRSSNRSSLWWVISAATAAACVAVHVGAGHAAAVRSFRSLALLSQWSHVVAVAAWIGGLLTLVSGIRDLPSDDAARAVRRFSALAAWAVVLVGATGTARAIAGLNAPSDLLSTGYGITITVKIAVFIGLCGFGLLHRMRSVPAAPTTTAPLRRLARPELVVAALAVGASGVLGSISPPADAAPPGFAERASDRSGELTAELVTQWRLPGPNKFDVTFVDGTDTEFDEVTLRFRPLDDPGVPATSLRLERNGDVYTGRGANLAFAGRWEVMTVAQAGARSWTIPFTLTTDAAPLFSTRTDLPGYPPEHLVQLADNSFIVVSPLIEAGQLLIRFADFATAPRPIDRVVVTATDATGRTAQLPIVRETAASFRAAYTFPEEPFEVRVVGRDTADNRLHATFDIDPALPDL